MLSSKRGYFKGAYYTIKFDDTSIPDISINSSLDGWYFGNIVFGGLIGMIIVDPITGSMWTLPSSVHSESSSRNYSSNTNANHLHIKSIENTSQDEILNMEPISDDRDLRVLEKELMLEAAKTGSKEEFNTAWLVYSSNFPSHMQSLLIRIKNTVYNKRGW